MLAFIADTDVGAVMVAGFALLHSFNDWCVEDFLSGDRLNRGNLGWQKREILFCDRDPLTVLV